MFRFQNACIAMLTTGLASACCLGQKAPPQQWDTFADTWVATDALGRKLPLGDEVGRPKDNRQVAIFYFLWLGQHGRGVHDISKILAESAETGEQPQWGPRHAFHFWREPIWGYYLQTDEAVIQKQMQMLSDAGVDILIFDNTNSQSYPACYLTVMRVLEQRRQAGMKTLKIASLGTPPSIEQIFRTVYQRKLYPELWAQWLGKPLILQARGDAPLPAGVADFFTVRKSWAWSAGKWFGDGEDAWAWLDHTPQKPGWHGRPANIEQISVSAAQHPTSSIGRSYQNGKEPAPADRRPAEGLYFTEQAKRALEVDPPLVFVTGWNEWIAQRFVKDKPGRFAGEDREAGYSSFVDQYDDEFSRDIEPARGGHGDNYYYQLAAFVRQYKGARIAPVIRPSEIKIDSMFDDWEKVQPEFRDDVLDPVRRDNAGFDGGGPYVNYTGRNDIVAAKVSYDRDNVYFYVRTREGISDPAQQNWMQLYIDSDRDTQTGWLGYDLLINYTPPGRSPTEATIARHTGQDYEWESAGKIEMRYADNELELAVPRTMLGEGKLSSLEFKWADNCYKLGDWTDFTLNGDAAPNDRFNYLAKLR